MSNLWLDMFTAGTLANRPTAPNANLPVALYYATDTAQLFYWTGSAWSAVATASVPGSATALGPVKSDNGVTTSIAPDGTLSIPKADNAGHLGVIKGDNATITIAGDGTASVTSASKGQFAFPGAVSQYVSSAIAAATQGNQFTPLVNMTIDQVVASWYGGGVAGHHYLCTIAALNGSHAITAITGSTTVIGTAANQDLTFNFAKLNLTAGTSYAIVITDTDAVATTTSVAVGGIGAASSLLPIYNTVPTANSVNDQRITLAKNTAPIVTDTFTLTGGLAAVGIRVQF